MQKETFKIPNISCGHCVNSIKSELTELDGVSQVNGDSQAQTITVSWDSPASRDAIKRTLTEINYPAE